MRIAMCMYGRVGRKEGRGNHDDLDFSQCHKSYVEHIFDKNPPIDVFVHSWSCQCERKIRKLYKPVMEQFDNQILFHGHDRSQRFLSRWYSTRESLNLKTRYEEVNGFVYDCVILMRFDLIFFSDLIFSDYDMQYFWCAEQGKYGIWDLWFYSNSKTMDYLKGIFSEHTALQSCKATADHMKDKAETKISLRLPQDFDLYRTFTKTDIGATP